MTLNKPKIGEKDTHGVFATQTPGERCMNSSGSEAAVYFPSKKDWWLVLLIWVGVIVSVLGGVIPAFLQESSIAYRVLIFCICLGMDALMLWVLYGTGYTITNDCVQIRCGPFHFQVYLEDISSITSTKNPFSSPACSLDRLSIGYMDSLRSIMISPKDQAGFLSVILARCPFLSSRDGRIIRKLHSHYPYSV